MTQRVLIAVVFAYGAMAGCDCSTKLNSIPSDLTVTINTPTQGEPFGINDTIDFNATATDLSGVRDLELDVGSQKIQSCTASGGNTVTCDGKFTNAMQMAQLVNGMYTLTAIAHNTKGQLAKASITISFAALKISFSAPPLTQNSPPVAAVGGTTAVTLQMQSAVPIASAAVTYDNNKPLENWTTVTGSNGAYASTAMVNWTMKLGTGKHTLTGTCTDTAGNKGKVTLDIVVKCTDDSSCPTGDRCCTTDGTCNPIVGEGADCDCTHPCPTDQGCFPGVCGATPQKCRPGCFWGSYDPPPYGTPPASCPNQNGVPAYCEELPPSQQTTANKGGACAVGDSCSITLQNCPSFPIDRSKPVSPTNPLVPFNCVPVSPTVNGCIPAGTLPVGGQNCNGSLEPDVSGTACGVVTNNCPKGTQCVTWVDQTGSALGPPSCLSLCPNPQTDPTTGGSGGCTNGWGCGSTFGLGMQFFNTGTCCARGGTACTNNTECCSIQCEGGRCCEPQGGPCNTNNDCCSGTSCLGGICF